MLFSTCLKLQRLKTGGPAGLIICIAAISGCGVAVISDLEEDK